ncbi:MAG: hypothetical protein IKT37_04820 [Clostridia bacterium]|nr:hypothetical protein [Clostridia bacterium]
MKNLLVGNGVNIQFDNQNYTTSEIVLRLLKNCDRDDFPAHIIVNEPYLLKNIIGQLFLEARLALQGEYDSYVTCVAEEASLMSFKEQYLKKLNTLRITDIGFEDYYLIHDLACHKYNIGNPDQFYTRESMRIAYLLSIYNDGKLDDLHKKYPPKFVEYLKGFDSIFTTNYDSNIDSIVEKKIFHIHGWFKQLAAVYDASSFRNQLPDAPIENAVVDNNYYYLYSNALTTHCGAYKEFQLKQYSYANEAVTKLAIAYKTNPTVKNDVEQWINDKNKITSNMGHAVKLKASNPNLIFSDDFHFDELSKMQGELEILGLSPWNDFHIFEAIEKSEITQCTYYYFSDEQRDKVLEMLPTLHSKGLLKLCPLKNFWSKMYEN